MIRGRFEVAYNERNRAAVRTERMVGEVAKDVRRTRHAAREAAHGKALRAVVFFGRAEALPFHRECENPYPVEVGEVRRTKGGNWGRGGSRLVRGARRGKLPAADGGSKLPHSTMGEALW
jgi:hypothetical protein